MIAYKLVRKRKNGTLGSLFINRKAELPYNTWMAAQDHKKKGYAYRPGWHCLFKPVAPHLHKKGRIWVKVEVSKSDYKVFKRPKAQGGKWILANTIKIVGPYRKEKK